MIFFRSILRVIKFTWQNILRNIWLSFATITIFVLTLLVVNAVLFVDGIATSLLDSVEERIEVTVYFEPETSIEIAESAQEFLLGIETVSSAQVIDRDENLESFRMRFAGNETVLNSLDEVEGNPLGHSIAVRADSSQDFAFISEAIDSPQYTEYIRSIDYTDNADLIERIQTIDERVFVGGIVLSVIFGLIAALIIFNTVRVAIYVHRDEIGIMKLVGAGDLFIRLPFLLEAMFYSLIATAITYGLIASAASGISRSGAWSVSTDVLTEFQVLFPQYAYQFSALAALSMVTSMLAMRRYLRV
jgi:cell division transport system permease protein